MAHPLASPITLTAAQQAALSSLRSKHHSSQQLVQRIKIIQAAADGSPNTAIALRLHTTRLTVRLWRDRWIAALPELSRVAADPKALEQCIARQLRDQPRSGAPLIFTPQQIARITALACEDPADSNRPISHWSPREVADEAVKRRIVPAISIRQVGRFLKRGQPQTPPDSVLAAPYA